MQEEHVGVNRRRFLKTAAVSALALNLVPGRLGATSFQADTLQVWSCGGLAEAFNKANLVYKEQVGVRIDYTGAFAAALGKSLLGGAVTEVFAGRVLKLAKKLREEEKMIYFRPFCFTEYVMITPRGNPANIQSYEDLARPGVRVILPLGASPPGGEAVMGILKKSGMAEDILKNTVEKESCVIKMMPKIISGKGQASIVERRLIRMAEFEGQVEVIPLPENIFPPGPLTFTIGVMKYARDRRLAYHYVDFVCSREVQDIFERQGFISAYSDRGKALVEKLGVKDV
jgi:molybdate transport system substrate-binding protein